MPAQRHAVVRLLFGPTVTTALVRVNLLLYAVSWLVSSATEESAGSSEDPLAPTAAVLLRAGALDAGRILKDGELWRLVACLFLHVNLLHLIFNLWVLRDLGAAVEGAIGRARFALLYLGSGLCASALSTWQLARSGAFSIGASGAIFGLFGALLVIGLARGGTFGRALFFRILFLVGAMFLIGSLMPTRIDHAAHAGGLIGGVLLGWLLLPGRIRGLGDRLLHGLAALALGASALTLVWTMHEMLSPRRAAQHRLEQALPEWQKLADDLRRALPGYARVDRNAMAREAGALRRRFDPLRAALRNAPWFGEIDAAARRLEDALRHHDGPRALRDGEELLRAMDRAPWGIDRKPPRD